jgi:conjugative transfer pilus assembly protein TraH
VRYLTIAILSLSSILNAGLLDRLQIIDNHSKPDIVASDELGVNFLGGSGTMRANVKDVNPVHVSLPKFKAGCGGIDYNMGAFHIASGKEMKEALKAILKSSVGYAFQLGMETATPSIAQTVGKIQQFANELNAININSCEMAQTLVNAVAPHTEAVSNAVCQHSSSALGKEVQNFVEGRHKCHSNASFRTKNLDKVKKNSDLLVGDFNIADIVFKKLNLDAAEKRFFLNITGTIVHQDGKYKTYPPKEIKTCDNFLYGGTVKDAYNFSGRNGLDIMQDDWTVTATEAWVPRKETAMRSLMDKLILPRAEQEQMELTEDEKKVLDGSKLPIGTLLVLKTRGEASSNIISLHDYAEIEAYMSLKDAIFDVLYEVRNLAIILLDAQVNDKDIKTFVEAIDTAKANLNFEYEKITKRVNEVQSLEKWLRDVEKYQRSE